MKKLPLWNRSKYFRQIFEAKDESDVITKSIPNLEIHRTLHMMGFYTKDRTIYLLFYDGPNPLKINSQNSVQSFGHI